MNAIVLSPYMTNVNPLVKQSQFKVMSRLCVEVPFVQILTNKRHGDTCNHLLNSCIKKGYDVVLLLDIDCIPLSTNAIMQTLYFANKGILAGNIQRSNHIENGKHLFVAPSFMGINLKIWDSIGRPSFVETKRGDVGEEVTYAWQEKGHKTIMYMPRHYESSPLECKSWALGDGMPSYGIGTTFANAGIDMSYHAFQIIHGKSLDQFLNRCDTLLQMI